MERLNMQKNIITILVLSCVFSCGGSSTSGNNRETWPGYPGTPGGPKKFIQASGTILINPDGSICQIKGISFTNQVYVNPSSPDDIVEHGPEDFAIIKSMGFNSSRFYINYGLFEDDKNPYTYKESGFEWLDKNIAAARTNDIRLIINMHYPQGGFQSNGEGDALWNTRENQRRLIALWKAIAERYKNEDYIIGYGLVNEPIPLTGVAQWANLAQEIINSIRSVDPYHVLFVEKVNGLKGGDTAEDRENNYFPKGLTDPGPVKNIVYEFHMYDPMPFTHQNASWIKAFVGKTATYPDTGKFINETWSGLIDINPSVTVGTSDWTSINGNLYQVNNTDYKIGKPVFQAYEIGSTGTVWFDDISIQEYDAEDNLVNTIWSSPVNSLSGWSFWSSDSSGSYEVDTIGSSDGKSIKINGTTSDATCTSDFTFTVTQGHKYRISGKTKGNSLASSAMARFRIDFYSHDGVWNKSGLQTRLNKYYKWGSEKNSPVYLGEFGAIKFSFDSNRGGTTWVTDMLDILTTMKTGYNYHTYHEYNFGIFMNDQEQVIDRNQKNNALADILTAKQL
jgi:endoglucanase